MRGEEEVGWRSAQQERILLLSSDTYLLLCKVGGRKQWESERLALAHPFLPTISHTSTYVFQLGDKMPLFRC